MHYHSCTSTGSQQGRPHYSSAAPSTSTYNHRRSAVLRPQRDTSYLSVLLACLCQLVAAAANLPASAACVPSLPAATAFQAELCSSRCCRCCCCCTSRRCCSRCCSSVSSSAESACCAASIFAMSLPVMGLLRWMAPTAPVAGSKLLLLLGCTRSSSWCRAEAQSRAERLDGNGKHTILLEVAAWQRALGPGCR